MTRFIMSPDNVVELLCSALSYCKLGEIFVQKTFDKTNYVSWGAFRYF